MVLLALFLIKSKTIFNNDANESAGIYSGDMKLSELVNTDTDLDGVMNWEEGLWGTNPTLKDTDGDGEEDGAEIEKLKLEKGGDEEATKTEGGNEVLTETDKFSRELFSTIVALNQAGEIDEASADKLTESLAKEIKNSVPRKVFVLSDIKTTPDNSTTSVQTYLTNLDNINKKYPVSQNVLDILKEFVNDGENVNSEALSKLDIIIKQKSLTITDFAKMSVPQDLAQMHLDMLNALQRVVENIEDMQMFEVDPIVAMGAISKYEENGDLLQSALTKLGDFLIKKLNN